jgi:hypothetical protein
MIYRAFKSSSTHDLHVGFEFLSLIGRYFVCLLKLVPRCLIGLCDHPLAICRVHGAGRKLRNIDLAILVHSLWLFDDLEERARDTSGSPELGAAVVIRVGVGRACLNPVTFLATTVADVAGRRRLVRDCRLLREEWAVVDSLTDMMLVYGRK